MTTFFDLETIADLSVIPILPDIEPDSRLKDPIKIKVNIEEKTIKRNSELGLDITTNRICCLSIKKDGDLTSFTANHESSEKSLLECFWDNVKDEVTFISFNGNNFDVPVLKFRSMINGVQPLVDIDTDKYRINNHYDLRNIITSGNPYQKGTLDFLAERLGCPIKPFGDGSMVQDWFDLKEYDNIQKHCETDIELLEWVYDKMKGIYF